MHIKKIFLFSSFQSAGTFNDMTGVDGTSYKTDKPRSESGSAGNLKARFEQLAKGDEEVSCLNFYLIICSLK